MAKRVIIALMDGVRPDAIEAVSHPFFEKLKKRGLSALAGRTVVPPRAFPAHISMFTSVGPEKHGIVSNDICPFPENYASLMQVLREAGKQTAAVVIWEQVCSVGRPEDINRLDFCDGLALEHLSPDKAREIQSRWVDRAADIIRREEFDFLFFQYEMADTVGHRSGWMSGEYLQAVRFTADCMARLFDALQPEDQFILLSDHGGHDFDHFDENDPRDMQIPLFCTGSLFPAGKQLESWSLLDIAPTVCSLFPAGKQLESWSLLDIAPTVCKALDVEIPEQFEGHAVI